MAFHDQPPRTTPGQRVLHMVLAGVITFACLGFFVGTRGIHPPTVTDIMQPHVEYDGPAYPARWYREMGGERLGPNREWTNVLSRLDQSLGEPPAATDEQGRRELAEWRATRRAYPGAPPVVPHSIDQMTSASCMACHGEGTRVGDRFASRMPHDFLPNCTQCHVEMRSPDLERFVLAENHFVPLEAPHAGSRAWSGAPPTIPHSLHMRNDCLACHRSWIEPLRDLHPWRENCLVCHAANGGVDHYAAERPRFLPPPIVIDREE